jgi:hypothetical protein
MDTWENQDPCASDNFWSYCPGANNSPYDQLVQIHKVADDANDAFFDSLVAVLSSVANVECGDFEFAFSEEGVYLN